MRRRPVTVLLVLAAATGCSGGSPSGSPAIGSPATGSPATEPAGTAAPDAAPPVGSSSGTAADPTAPVTGPTASVAGPPESAVTPDGFARVQASVTETDGTVCEVCLWLADSGDRRSRGLMFVTDLGAADGMAFVYPRPHDGNFWMKNTLLPLSIAFFGPDGRYLDAFDMEPCTAEPCELYPTPDDFLVAIETTRGDLGELGIGPGSVLALSDLPCP